MLRLTLIDVSKRGQWMQRNTIWNIVKLMFCYVLFNFGREYPFLSRHVSNGLHATTGSILTHNVTVGWVMFGMCSYIHYWQHRIKIACASFQIEVEIKFIALLCFVLPWAQTYPANCELHCELRSRKVFLLHIESAEHENCNGFNHLHGQKVCVTNEHQWEVSTLTMSWLPFMGPMETNLTYNITPIMGAQRYPQLRFLKKYLLGFFT